MANGKDCRTGPIKCIIIFDPKNELNHIVNKLKTFEDALFEGSKISTHKTERLDADLLPCGKRYAEELKSWSSLNG